MDTIKVGFVGAGYMGQLAHLWNYYNIDNCDVVSLAEPREELAEQVARRHGIENTFTDHRELLAETDPDAIVAILDYVHHGHIVPDILEEGIPVFTEKPLATSVSAGQRLAKIGTEQGTRHMVGYHKRSDPAMEYAMDVVAEWEKTGTYGEMNYVRLTIPPGDGWGGVPDPIRTDEEPLDQPVDPNPESLDEDAEDVFVPFLPYYCHQINLLRHVLGDYELTFADPTGTVLTVKSSDGACGVLEIAPYSTSKEWHETLLIAFENAFIQVSFPAPLSRQQSGTVEIWKESDGSAERVRPTLPDKSAMCRQAENFLATARGEREPPCDAEEAVKDIEVAQEYIQRLHRTEDAEWVHVPI